MLNKTLTAGIFCLFVTPSIAQEQTQDLESCFSSLKPFEVTYDLSSGLISVDSKHRLSRSGQTWEYKNEADGGLLGNALEYSRFRINNGEFQLLDHQSKRRVAFNRRNRTLSVDWAKGLVKTSRGDYDLVNVPFFDKATQQLAIQCLVSAGHQQFSITLADFGHSDVYKYRVTGEETLKVNGKAIDTLKVTQKRSDNRTVEFWLAPEFDHIPVKFRYAEDGDATLTATLHSMNLNI